jgi:Ca-activated chloride channel family protein
MVALLVFSIPGTGSAASLKEVEKARDAYKEGRYEAARDGYKRLSADKEPPPTPREELAYGLGASSLQLKDYDTSTRAFSEALRSSDAMVQRRAQRGLATALYNHGDTIIAKQPEQTIKSWIDARDHFDSAMKITPEGTPEFTELKENRDFVQKRLDELKEQQEQKKKDKDKQKQQGKGQGEPQEQEGEGQQNQEQQQAGDQQGQKKTDAMQKDQGALPEGQIRAGEGGKPDDKQQGSAQPSDEDKRNDQTGFTPQEARSQLRNYADDQKSVQYLMRKESPEGGKDY